MATRTWLKLMRNSFAAGAVLVAAQLGVGSGLGVLDWRLSFSAIGGWGQLLTWVAFIFAAGVVGGAVIGRRALRRPRPVLRIWGRLGAAGAAGLGGAAAIVLVWIPVRVSQPPVDLRAELTMTVTAALGVLVGVALAVAALSWRAVAAGIAISASWVWLFALASVGLAAKDHVRVSPRLGMIDAPQVAADAWWFDPFLMVGIAAVLGFAVAAAAGWKGAGWLGIALSGLAGPALVASAYLITGWGFSGNGEAAGPYVAALASLGAGLLASMAVASATIPHRLEPRNGAPGAAPTTQRPTLPAPLAITSYAEPAYVLESSAVEPAYRRQPAFYTETIYLPEPRAHSGQTTSARPEPAARPDLNKRPEPAPEATYEPPYEAPYESPYDPKNPPRPAVASTPIVDAEVAPRYEPGHAATVEAVVVEPVAIAPGAVVEDAVVVESTEPASTEPASTEPAVPAPTEPAVPAPASTVAGKRKGRPKDKVRRPSARRGRGPDNESKSRDLRQGERDHIDWIDNLVKLPADPTLKMTKER